MGLKQNFNEHMYKVVSCITMSVQIRSADDWIHCIFEKVTINIYLATVSTYVYEYSASRIRREPNIRVRQLAKGRYSIRPTSFEFFKKVEYYF
jgi:hypothetical protein